MISINLLPEDRRPVERTPLPRFLTILGGVFGFCIELLVLVFVLTKYPGKQQELEDVKHRIGGYQDTNEQIDKLEAEISVFQMRKSQIEMLYRNRRNWTPILNRLYHPEVLPQNIWFSKMELKEGSGGGVRSTPVKQLTISGYAWARNEMESAPMFQALNQFAHNLMAEHPDFSEVFDGEPEVKRMDVVSLAGKKDDPSVPRRALAFILTLKVAPDKGGAGGGR